MRHTGPSHKPSSARASLRFVASALLLLYVWLSAGLEFHHNHAGLCSTGLRGGATPIHAQSGTTSESPSCAHASSEGHPEAALIATTPEEAPCLVDLFTRDQGKTFLGLALLRADRALAMILSTPTLGYQLKQASKQNERAPPCKLAA